MFLDHEFTGNHSLVNGLLRPVATRHKLGESLIDDKNLSLCYTVASLLISTFVGGNGKRVR